MLYGLKPGIAAVHWYFVHIVCIAGVVHSCMLLLCKIQIRDWVNIVADGDSRCLVKISNSFTGVKS